MEQKVIDLKPMLFNYLKENLRLVRVDVEGKDGKKSKYQLRLVNTQTGKDELISEA